MLDETIVVTKVEAENYTPLPDDVYTVELVDIVSEQRPTYDTRSLPKEQQEMETVFNFLFGVLDSGEDVRGRRLIQSFVPSYLYISNKGKNKLYQIVEALQGDTVSPDQEAFGISGKELNMLVGKQCRVGTKTEAKGDKSYTNIDKWLVSREPKTALTADEKSKLAFPKKEEVAA
jgi:hypothetical protein